MSNATNNTIILTVGDLMPSYRTSGANCWAYFDPEKMEVYKFTNIGNGTPMRAWHGIDITIGEIPIDTASTESLEEMLASMADVFAELSSEHEVRWNGSNHVGKLTERGQEIYEKIERAFEESVGDLPSYWEASNWFDPVSSEVPQEILGVGSITEWADEQIGIAQIEGAYLDRDEVIRFGKHALEQEADGLMDLLDDDSSEDDEEDTERCSRLDSIKKILEEV